MKFQRSKQHFSVPVRCLSHVTVAAAFAPGFGTFPGDYKCCTVFLKGSEIDKLCHHHLLYRGNMLSRTTLPTGPPRVDTNPCKAFLDPIVDACSCHELIMPATTLPPERCEQSVDDLSRSKGAKGGARVS